VRSRAFALSELLFTKRSSDIIIDIKYNFCFENTNVGEVLELQKLFIEIF